MLYFKRQTKVLKIKMQPSCFLEIQDQKQQTSPKMLYVSQVVLGKQALRGCWSTYIKINI